MGHLSKVIAASVFASCAALATVPANAGVITVVNPSFETLPAGGLPLGGCGTGCAYSQAAIPGWVNAGVSGQFQPGNPSNSLYFSSLSDGPTNAYSNDMADITQTVGVTVVQGVTYTLLVDIGNRFDAAMTGSADLLINGIYYGGLVPSAPEGTFGTETVSYIGLAADVGQSITIVLRANGPQANFDNVRLSDDTTSDVPEPATLALFGAGLAGLCTLRRRKPKA